MAILSDFTLCTIAIALVYVGADWTDCPDSCKCVWSNGKKTAECENANFTKIPNTFSMELQVLNLNRNNLRNLADGAFSNAGIYNLHKIYLRECGIELVSKNSLSGLKVLIEIDFSHNKIRSLHKDLFKDCGRLREIKIANNPIQTLEDGLFYNLTFLQIIDFSYCKLHRIGLKTFANVPSLSRLELKGNNFSYLPVESVSHLGSLKTLGLEHNPWNCDCHLRPLRNWVTERNLYSIPTVCKEPFHLEDKQWSEIGDEDSFACEPKIIVVTQESNNVLSCLAEGDPVPLILWIHNGISITNRSFDYSIREISFAKKKLSNLTVGGSRAMDGGEYSCVARNLAGKVETRIRVEFDRFAEGDLFYGSGGDSRDTWLMLVGCLIGASLLILIIVFLKCYVCRRRDSTTMSKKKKDNTNGMIGQMMDVEEKSLMSVINPVQKPPRRQEISPSNSEAELRDFCFSQSNGNCLFLDSTATEDKELPTESTPTLRKGIQSLADLDSSSDVCPPDLLSFSTNSGGRIPSPELRSFATPNDRLPPSGHKCPPNGFRRSGQFGTLPYSRSHSPFSPASVATPRQSGYVTIPRKPRTPSWTASLSPVLLGALDNVDAEPIYDNLGPRTTADGSSLINLIKCDSSFPSSYKNRPLPQTPVDAIRFRDPIDELQSYSLPLKNPRIATAILPINQNVDKTRKNPSALDQKRHSWSRMTPDEARTYLSGETESLIPSKGPPKKVPPIPPPKPKKPLRNPFRESEDEDERQVHQSGTEV